MKRDKTDSVLAVSKGKFAALKAKRGIAGGPQETERRPAEVTPPQSKAESPRVESRATTRPPRPAQRTTTEPADQPTSFRLSNTIKDQLFDCVHDLEKRKRRQKIKGARIDQSAIVRLGLRWFLGLKKDLQFQLLTEGLQILEDADDAEGEGM